MRGRHKIVASHEYSGRASVQAVLQRIRAQTGEMETLAALKAAGLEGVQMHSDFGAGHGSQSRETGSQSKTLEDF